MITGRSEHRQKETKSWGALELTGQGDEKQLAKEPQLNGQRGDLRGKPVVSWKPSKNDVLRRRMGSTVSSAADRSRKAD